MLVVNGDSFVHEFHLPEEHRWSNLINADKNLAFGGGSNDRLFHTTVECLNNHDVKILVLGWTTWVRSFFNKSNGSRYRLCGDSAMDETGDWEDGEYVAKFYLTKVFNEFTQFKNMLTYMLHIQKYCKLRKIKLVNFATLFDESSLTQNNLLDLAKKGLLDRKNIELEQASIKQHQDTLSKYISNLDQNTWVNKKLFHSIQESLSDSPRVDSVGHFGSHSAKKWAEIIQNHIDQ